MSKGNNRGASRRQFLKQSGAGLAGAALAGVLSARAYAADQNTIKIALIGCGGRGTGAAHNALSTAGPVKLVAMADVFADRLEGSLKSMAGFGKRVDVPPERQFLGLHAYKQAIDAIAPGGVALLTTPPGFRPIHLEYAVQKGCHVFMEKSFAVDAPGIRRVLKAGEAAVQKNLKIAGGLMSRHYKPLEEAVEELHKGIIGERITCWAYRVHGPVGFSPKAPGQSDMAHQIRNYSNYTWVNGSFLLDWLIHNLDVCCWCKGDWPVEAQGMGGRQVRDYPDQLFDHYTVEYHFPDGTRLFAQGRHQANTWGSFRSVIHSEKGCAVLGEGVSEPKIYKGFHEDAANVVWQYKGPPCNHYQREHDLLFAAIREDRPYNETERCAKAAMVGILGRMACESGQLITWEDAMKSNLELAPGLDKIATLDGPAPILPDAHGQYPVAKPGFTKVL